MSYVIGIIAELDGTVRAAVGSFHDLEEARRTQTDLERYGMQTTLIEVFTDINDLREWCPDWFEEHQLKRRRQMKFYVSASYPTSDIPWGSLDDALVLAGGESDGRGTCMTTGDRDIGFPKRTKEEAIATCERLRAVHPLVRASYHALPDDGDDE